MAKKQTFGDKVSGKKQSTGKDHIKLIRSGIAKKSGALRFYQQMIKIPEGKNPDVVIKDILTKGN